ncbi:hypothetical protein LQZ18_02460 [Lachnospiraceae bacterium ZAX-1]
MIAIHISDIEKAADTLETECLVLKMEQVFLAHLESEKIYQSIKRKIEYNESLTEEELMQLIILPLTEKGIEKKQKAY